MTFAVPDAYTTPLSNPVFLGKEKPNLDLAREAPQLPPEAQALVQKALDIEATLDRTTIDPSSLPPRGQPIFRQAISALQLRLQPRDQTAESSLPHSSVQTLLDWMQEKCRAIAVVIHTIANAFFAKAPPEISIEAILDELKTDQAISPAQCEEVLRLAQQPEKKPALMLLTTLLGFSTSELSHVLTTALATSPENAFSLLLEAFLIKKFAANDALQAMMNEEDRKSLSTLTFEGLFSSERIKQQLRCLRSLAHRLTIRSWIENLPHLLTSEQPSLNVQVCLDALRLNDPTALCNALSPFLLAQANSPISNESLYGQELLAFLSKSSSFEQFATEIRRQKFISQWSGEVRALKKAANVVIASNKCAVVAHRTLSQALALLKDEHIRSRYLPAWSSACVTFRASQEGAIARDLRKIESLKSRLDGATASSEALKPTKHVLHLACSCGGGHLGMVAALNGSFRSASSLSAYHFSSEALDVPTQVTRPADFVHTLSTKLGFDIDTTWVYNFLLRHDLCSVIEFLKWLTSGTPSQESTLKRQSLIRQAILARDPDFLDMVYAFDGNDIDAVSQQLGLPLLYVATDLDLNDWRTIPSSPFFREAVPTLHHPKIRSTLHVPEQKVEEIGLCVGPEFETKLSAEQLLAVRARYGIAPHEKVVVFSNGGTALQNSIPARIALEYNDTSTPIHLIVICGKNESFKEYLETKVRPSIPEQAPVHMTVLGFQQRAQMAELTQLADVVIGKPGGMSTMEFVKSGTKVIFDETSYRMHWERFNADVVVNSGRGAIMHDPSQLLTLLHDSLRTNRRRPMPMAQVRASERYVDLVNRLLTEAGRPETDGGWQARKRSWHRMNKRMNSFAIGF